MRANEANLLDFLNKAGQFTIPIYQRTYSWTERECRQLWDDIVRTGRNDTIPAHFVGSIVYIQQGLPTVINKEPLLVIDGQQRLTTVTLIIAALAKVLDQLPESAREVVDGFSPEKLRDYYLVNPLEKGLRHYKLILTQTDKDSLIAVITGAELPPSPSLRVKQNLALFESWIAGLKGNLVPLCKGLAKLAIVEICLNRSQDNPQLIFESMNSTGRELTQADLIRNYILMGLEPDLQTRLYDQYWRPVELGFGQEAYDTHFDGFMRHYLTVKTGQIPNVRDVYEAFKTHARSPKAVKAGVEALVSEVRTYARYFCAMELDQETDKGLREAFQDLRELRVDVAYPFLLDLYHDYVNGVLSQPDFLATVRLVESYVFRRAVCGVPTNSLNKTFATFTKAIKKDHYLESIQAHLLGLLSYRRFPADDEFGSQIKTRDLYNFSRRSYWLRRLENFGHVERIYMGDYTIEHIMPQNEDLSPAWRSALGTDWQQVQKTWLHSLGNLTLTGYNSEYGDKSFPEKRDHPKGFRASPIVLNADLREAQTWNEAAIIARADRLAARALEVWSYPHLPPTVLAAYRQPGGTPSAHTIDDHPYLAGGPARELFEAFRREVLALDPVVTEEFLKYYIAYKAETNFVDVVPLAKRLRLSINIPFHEISDPRHTCRDVTGLGKWGNGNTEAVLSSLDELPYVMGLVRQALERQLGSNGGA